MKEETHDINEIIIRYLDGSAELEEKRLLLRWLKQSDDNRDDFIATRDLWLSCNVAAGNELEIDIALGKLKNRILLEQGRMERNLPAKRNTLSVVLRWTRIAAVLLLLLGIGYGIFEVAKDAKKPFVVQAGEIDVEVLGTCFDLDSYSSGEFVKTALLNGSVKISGKALKDPVYLKPDELFRYRKSDQTASVEEAKAGLYTDWIKDRLVFDNDCLADILISMEGRYNMDIECPKQFAAATRLSFTIRQESIEEVMEAMSLIAPIRYEIKKNKVYITPRK